MPKSITVGPAVPERFPCQTVNARELIVVVPTHVLLAWAPEQLASFETNEAVNSDPIASVREQQQRGAKRSNVESFENYVLRMVKGAEFGTTPEVMLYSEQRLTRHSTQISGMEFEHVEVPKGHRLSIISGESQKVARQRAAKSDPLVFSSRVSVRILHGVGPELARQAYSDLALGVKAVASNAVAMDSRCIATQITHTLIEAAPVLRGRVVVERQLARSDTKSAATLNAIRTGVVSTILGGGGLQLGSKPLSAAMSDEQAASAGPHVVELWTKMLDHFSSEFDHPRRLNSIVPTPGMLAALGIVLHDAMPAKFLGVGDKPKTFEEVLGSLSDVSWDKEYDNGIGGLDSVWAGIAGKGGLGEGLQASGPKEVAHKIVSALRARDTATWKQVRSQAAPEILAETLTVGRDTLFRFEKTGATLS